MKVHSCIVILLLLACLPLVSCSAGASSPTAVPITLQYTSASYPWLVPIYDCAGNTVIIAEQTAADFQDLQTADIAIRLGQPENLPSPTYQIGTDDLLVIVNPQNPIKLLTVARVRSLFNGQIQNWRDVGGTDAPVQVWAFTKAEDIQDIFNHLILSDSPVTSMARLASNPNEMTQAVSKDINAIGILNRRLKTSGVSDVFTVTSMPVLAFTRYNPTERISNILSCLQK